MKDYWGKVLFIISFSFLTIGGGLSKPNKKIEFFSVAQTPDWSTPVNISKTALASYTPHIGVDAGGKCYVIWTDYETSSVRYVCFNTNKSGQWTSSQRITPIYSGSDDAGYPVLVVSSEGICHMALHDLYGWNNEVLYWEYVNNWSSVSNVSTSEGGSAYPTLALSPTDGYLYAVWMDSTFLEFDIMYRYRHPDTKQWGIIDTIPLLYGGQYMPSLTIDGKGTAHLVWTTRSIGDSAVWYVKNPEPRNNAKWTAPILLATTGVEWCYPRIASDNAGDVYVVWLNGSTGNLEIFLRRTINQIWQPVENISQSPDISEAGAIAVNKNTGEFYIAWQENVGGTNWEVYLKAYEQEKPGESRKWSTIKNISNSPTTSGEPSVCVADNGDVHIAYIDNKTGYMEVWYTFKEKISIYPPVNVALTTSVNKLLFYSEKINTITFSKNPLNQDAYVAKYKLYRRTANNSDEDFKELATLSPSTLKYEDRGLALAEKYAYALTTVNIDGKESKKSDVVTEQ